MVAAGAAAPPPPRAATAATRYNRVSAIFPAGDAVRGKALSETCMACHGEPATIVGDPAFRAPKLRYQRPSTLFYALQDYRSGARKSDIMGPVAMTLHDQDMRDLAAYLSARTQATKLPPKGGPALADSWAHAKNDAVCGMCHGEAGLGVMDGYPVLGGQHRDYLEHALAEYRSGGRKNPIMATFARSLKPDEVMKMAEYFAAQSSLEQAR